MMRQAPSSGTYSLNSQPRYGMKPAKTATALSLLTAFPRYANIGVAPVLVGTSAIPKTRFENDSAKSNIVKMSASDVRGMTLEGRYVSSAACDMLSRPTNEMIASDTPRSKFEVVGQCACMLWTSKNGLHANTKPQTKMSVSLTTSSAETISLIRDDCLTPSTLIAVRNAVMTRTHAKYHAWCAVSHGTKTLKYPMLIQAKSDMSIVKSSTTAQPAMKP